MSKQPFYARLYFRPAWSDLALAIGYRGLPFDEARQVVKALEEKHGREVMEQAVAEIVRVDQSTNPHRVRLSDECRKWCRQLLGEPPREEVAPPP